MYEFELQQQAAKTRQKIMFLVFAVALIAAIIIGIALRMQQVKNIEQQNINTTQNPDDRMCTYCITDTLDFSITATPTPTLIITEAPTISGPTGTMPPISSTGTPTQNPGQTQGTTFSASLTGKDCVEPGTNTTFLLQVTNTGNTTGKILKIQNAFPNGFSYVADTAKINNRLLDAQYIKIESAGNAILVEFTIPDAFSTLAPNDKLTLEYTAKADNPDIGTNTDLAIIVPYQGPAIDNITYQFEVANSCSTTPNLPPNNNNNNSNNNSATAPDTGILDNAIVLGVISMVFILTGLYLRKAKQIAFLAPFVKLYRSVRKHAYELSIRKDPKAFMEYKIINQDSKHKNSAKANESSSKGSPN